MSKSSVEAKYRAIASTVCELLWIFHILQDLRVPIQLQIPLYCDNKAALHIATNPIFHEHTKHNAIGSHIVREQLQRGFIHPHTSQLVLSLQTCSPSHYLQISINNCVHVPPSIYPSSNLQRVCRECMLNNGFILIYICVSHGYVCPFEPNKLGLFCISSHLSCVLLHVCCRTI